jgi:hypothetical protein
MTLTRPLWLICLLVQVHASAEEYSFDLESFEKKPWSIGGYAEFKYTDQSLNRGSLLAGVAKASDYIRTGTLELAADYSRDNTRFSSVMHGFWLDDDFGELHDTSFYEAFVNHRFSDRFSTELGKRSLRWGKGYAWNPVAVVERQKDPLDPDLSREGFVIASIDYVQSYDGDLQTLAFTPVFLPVRDDLNEDYGESANNVAAKLYLLYRDIDIDVIYRNNGSHPARLGIDFSMNLASNFEVHGELSHGKYNQKVLSGTRLLTREDVSNNLLLGFRYLTEQETTYIFEYYHNDEGYDEDEMRDFYRFVASSNTSITQARAVSRAGYNTRHNMRDYLFFKINQKDAFDILYLTPGLTMIYNLNDQSYSFNPEVVYTGIDNLELRLRATLLDGDNYTEFGEKPTEGKLEFRMRYTF